MFGFGKKKPKPAKASGTRKAAPKRKATKSTGAKKAAPARKAATPRKSRALCTVCRERTQTNTTLRICGRQRCATELRQRSQAKPAPATAAPRRAAPVKPRPAAPRTPAAPPKPKSAAEQIMDAFAQANERRRARESAPRTSTEPPRPAGNTQSQSAGTPPPPRRARVNRQDFPGISNVNYAAPGAHVGMQTAVNHGGTVRSGDGTHNTTTPPRDDEFERRVQDKVRQATERAEAATKRAERRTEDAPEDGGPGATHNVARGDEHVDTQIGIQYGDVHRRTD